jgi:hypothetical protein
MVQAPRSAAMPNRVFLGARGPAAQRKPDQSIGGTRLGRRVVEPRRTLIIDRVAVRRLFRITGPTQIASDWLIQWHAAVALVVLPGDCVAAPDWCSSNREPGASAANARRTLTRAKNPAAPKGELWGASAGVVPSTASSRCPQLLARRSFCAPGNMRPNRVAVCALTNTANVPPNRPVDPGPSFDAAHGCAHLCALAYIRARFLVLYCPQQ